MPASYDIVRDFCRTLPGAVESTSYGTPAIKVRGKLMVRLREDGTTLVVKVSFADRDFLIGSDPKVFFLTDHYRNYPWVLVNLAAVRRDQLRELLEEAWRSVSSKTQIAAYEGDA